MKILIVGASGTIGSADETAEVYLAALNGSMSGETLRVAEFLAA
ncbi:hypothetical protein [Ferrimonas futtsuensis]|nr:hypothetical protein [Ferrimonas futtsuensis]